jgi:TM2 domain-containing membrane protein YozV
MSEDQGYRVRWKGVISQPLTIAQINARFDSHEVGLGHEIEVEGEWLTLERFFKLAPAGASTSGEPPQPPPPGPLRVSFSQGILSASSSAEPGAVSGPLAQPIEVPAYQPRKLAMFVGLGLLLGFFGAHHFYAGRHGRGILQILLTLALVALDLGIIWTWLWALVEIMVVRTDRNGARMI